MYPPEDKVLFFNYTNMTLFIIPAYMHYKDGYTPL